LKKLGATEITIQNISGGTNLLNPTNSFAMKDIRTQETRERVMDKVSIIMENMNAEVVCGDVEPIVVSGDLGG
jgi:hypothetical protein